MKLCCELRSRPKPFIALNNPRDAAQLAALTTFVEDLQFQLYSLEKLVEELKLNSKPFAIYYSWGIDSWLELFVPDAIYVYNHLQGFCKCY
jgi:hypothetical protein